MSFRDNIRYVTPYVPGEQPQGEVIKLNTNECPYPPSPRVAESLAALKVDDLRKYPDPAARMLTDSIAEYYGLSPEQVFVGVGSDDCLALCFLTFFGGQKPILFPDITYSFYKVWANVYDITYTEIPLAEDFSVTATDYRRENGGICLANPNAPTGLAMPLANIEAIVAANQDSVVIIDEAYIDFGGETALPLLDKYENLLIVRTMSKSRAMAGMRIGYVFGCPELIKCLNDVKFSINSYTMNLPSLVAGQAAMADDAYFRDIIAKIKHTRAQTMRSLSAMGFVMPDSATNFIFAAHPQVKAAQLFESLKERRIYVRYFNAPRIDNYLRITVGTDAEMEKLLAALKELIE